MFEINYNPGSSDYGPSTNWLRWVCVQLTVETPLRPATFEPRVKKVHIPRLCMSLPSLRIAVTWMDHQRCLYLIILHSSSVPIQSLLSQVPHQSDSEFWCWHKTSTMILDQHRGLLESFTDRCLSSIVYFSMFPTPNKILRNKIWARVWMRGASCFLSLISVTTQWPPHQIWNVCPALSPKCN